MIEIKDKKIVIVGASSGIGKELAKICVEKEAIVYLISRTERKLLNLQNELGGRTFVHAMDMLDEHSVNETFKQIGQFDYMTVTAVADETKLFSPIKSMPTELAQRGMEKFWGTFNCSRAAANYISEDGAMVLTSSVAIFKPSKNASIMNAASAAVAVFAKAFALEIAPTRVNVVAPGVVATGVWTEEEKESYRDWAAKTLPVKHLGTPKELAYAYYSILTNPYMTGGITNVDGGLTLV
ncbi:SDR family oxidoreductase [Aquimarina sp. Aq107]|uniref:SDR family oxidoreductase n=1 Tax=Aquimarina sp. Aq107 TaxID=1191912 RepID=UPI0019024957|nr:SDR family oxidoreductase [Aquimarina sp. Aq107]